MYDQSDPRAALGSAPVADKAVPSSFAAAEYGRFYDSLPQDDDSNGRSWYIRGQNFIVHYMEAVVGATLVREDQADEYAVILPDVGSEIRIVAGEEAQSISGGNLVFVPPGASRIEVTKSGRVVRLLTSRAADLAGKCSNEAAYREPHASIPPFAAWPAPRNGYRIRPYPLKVAPAPGRFGSIYRCSTLMINMLDSFAGPRDATKLSPHFHDDFEQCSLALEGGFMHYIRWPWTTDLHAWRDDDKEYCGAPSVVVIPPPAIHTSRAIGAGTNQLVDIFCPPRIDFSEKAGWILNADDYPLPGEA